MPGGADAPAGAACQAGCCVEGVGGILGLAVGGLVIGLLARFAVPGPDPMPLWLTAVFGAAGALLGGGIGFAMGGPTGGILGGVIVASLLIIGYRRLVQKRPLTGPRAHERPRRRGDTR